MLGQRLLVKQPIEGFHGIGEVIAYSSSRIFLQLNKDGDWPNQIQWEIKDESGQYCYILFSKVGWKYSSRPECYIDWLQMNPSRYSHRLYVVEQTPIPSEILSYTEDDSILLIRNPKLPNSTNTITNFNPKPLQANPSPIKSDSIDSRHLFDQASFKSGQFVLLDSQEIFQITSSERQENYMDIINYSGQDINKDLLQDSITNQFIVLNTAISSEKPKHHSVITKHEKRALSTSENTIIPDSVSWDQSITKLINQLELTELSESEKLHNSSSSPDTSMIKNQTYRNLEYQKPLTEYQFKRKTFSRKKSISPAAYPIDFSPNKMVIIEHKDSTISSDSHSEFSNKRLEELSRHDAPTNETSNDTIGLHQNAPFISVASFGTLNYAQQVLPQFHCPSGCLIVKSNFGNNYRIGFYPNPENIFQDLQETRKKYPDAWLVKF